MNLNYFNQFSSYKEDETNNKEVWVYTRVSSKQQLDGFSLENQLESSKQFANINNYKITNTFGGNYESAKVDFTRKEFKKLIDFVKRSKKKPFAILIYKMNRFSRSGGGAVGLVNELIHDLDVHLIEVVSGKNTTTDRGENEIMEELLKARKEQIDRMESTLPGLISFVEQGNWLGNVPRGYDHFGTRVTRSEFISSEQKIVINNEGKLLQKAWKWKLEGEQDFIIKQKLESKGLFLSKQFISAMWRKPFYCGISTHSFLKGKSIKGKWKGLVSVTDFQIINERINSNSNNGYKQSKFNENRPLQQFMICGKCGTSYTGYKAKKHYDYYKCNNPKCNSKDMNADTSSKSEGINDLFIKYLSKYQ